MIASNNFMVLSAIRVGACLFALLVSAASHGAAQEHVELMEMPAAYTDVIDAFDGADVWDVNVRAGFVRSSRSGTIQRETVSGDRTVYRNVANHTRVTNSLQLGLDVGIYQDLALYGVLPIVLRDSRELELPSDRTSAQVDDDLYDPVRDAMNNPLPNQEGALFQVPFKAPPRSGIPAVHLGIAWAASNQFRTHDLPTWVLMLEARIATGDVLKACDGNRECAAAGVGEGTSSVRFESRTSYRFRYVEPYVGFAAELQWVSTGDQLFGSEFDGLIHRQPPRTGELTVGASIVPWEDRERFQRVALDVRLRGAYVSEGRDVTPLFDALGSSRNQFLTAPNYDRLAPITGNPATDPREVPMTGVTDTSAHARIAFQAGTVIQAAKYIRFMLGFGLSYATPYLLTGADACNPSVRSTNETRGNCGASGVFNPAHRPVIDVVGNRFRLNGEVTFDLYSSATAQF